MTSPALPLSAALLAACTLASGRDDRRERPAAKVDDPVVAGEAWRRDFQRGVVLTMHSKERAFDYGPAISEIAALGANWVEIAFAGLYHSVKATAIDRMSNRTPVDEDLVATIRKAKAAGLRVLLFPVVLIKDPGPDDWRGVLEPTDLDEWFRNYRAFILHYAKIAAAEGVEAFSVGTEFCRQEGEKFTRRWLDVISAIREIFPGLLTYSANWDHYDVPEFWDALDFVGMSSYHRLSNSREPELSELVESWRKVREKVVRWSKDTGKRVVFTELGYPSLDDCSEYPWNYLMKNPVDLDEQADCFRAFAEVWRDEPALLGVYIYEWWGEGGPEDKSYTPRGKPAEGVIREYYRDLAGRAPSSSR